MIFAIGWSGEWAADFSRDEAGKNARVRCGMANTHLTLHPGEEIRTPRVAVLFHEGGSLPHGQNLLRAFLLAHHRPKAGGIPLEPIRLNGNWGGTSAKDHLENIKTIVDHDLPVDYYWIDAEWFGQGPWHRTTGDWTPKADLYPQGFRPLADALHASGRKLLLWFEPERVCEGTPWYEEHKDWLLDVPKEKRHYNWGTSQADPEWVAWESARNQIRENDRLFNLGDPAARAFLTDFISNRITEFGLDCFRHDANIAPLEFWRAADAPDRQGMTEIRWVEGLYAFWDGLLVRHPGLIIDNCASGGRRIDLESISRSTPFWRTDFPAGPTVKQCHTYGISSWIPMNGTGAVNPVKLDAYAVRSTWSSSLEFELFSVGDAPQPETDRASFALDKAKDALRLYGDVKPYFLGDYYPLTEYSQAEDAWVAWQFHRDDLGAGLVQVFRRPASICESGKIVLQGLDPKATYDIVNLDTHIARAAYGAALAKEGILVTFTERPSAAVFTYKERK
jgi:alpha-galactosidase